MSYHQNKTYSKKYWFHVWSGLVFDKKHRERMGIAIWLYLDLLSLVERVKGSIVCSHEELAEATFQPVHVLRWRLNILKKEGYIETERCGKLTKITITKWRPVEGKKETWLDKKIKENQKILKEKENERTQTESDSI